MTRVEVAFFQVSEVSHVGGFRSHAKMSAAGAGMEAEMEAWPGMARIGTDWHGLASLGMEWHRMAQIDRDGMK